jgi:hypothetical protein
MNRNLKASLAVLVATAIVMMSAAVVLGQGGANASASTSASAVQTVGIGGTAAVLTGSATVTCHGQSNIPFGAAANFRVLAGTTVTNTGATVVKGNLGVSPGSAVTGFPPGKVTGAIDKANTASAAAQLALGVAYKDAFGRTGCPHAVSGNIGGMTLTPGLYKSTSSLAISSGDLTLTASGHPSGVFVFQIASTFTVTKGLHVILAGGALANNIYWAVGSSAVFGTTAVIYGNVLAHKSISLATGAVLHGRALAHLGAVTLEGNTVSSVPAAMPTPSIVGTSPVLAPFFRW